MKLQSEHLQVQSLPWETVRYDKAASDPQGPSPLGTAADVSELASVLQDSIPTDLSANKRAMVERLMKLWAEGAVNQ